MSRMTTSLPLVALLATLAACSPFSPQKSKAKPKLDVTVACTDCEGTWRPDVAYALGSRFRLDLSWSGTCVAGAIGGDGAWEYSCDEKPFTPEIVCKGSPCRIEEDSPERGFIVTPTQEGKVTVEVTYRPLSDGSSRKKTIHLDVKRPDRLVVACDHPRAARDGTYPDGTFAVFAYVAAQARPLTSSEPIHVRLDGAAVECSFGGVLQGDETGAVRLYTCDVPPDAAATVVRASSTGFEASLPVRTVASRCEASR